MSLEIGGICSDTWNIVINITEHWMGKSRKLEIAKCGMLLGKCYFAVHHKSNTETLPLVTYTCCCFYAHKKASKLKKNIFQTKQRYNRLGFSIFPSQREGFPPYVQNHTEQENNTKYKPKSFLWKFASLCTHM